MFRFNNPDALLVLLMIGAAGGDAAGDRSHPGAAGIGLPRDPLARTRRLARRLRVPDEDAAGVPRAARLRARLPAGGRRTAGAERIRDLAVALVALVVSAGWWITIVALWPASDRPYIGGSQHNSILELTLGYNGFGRLSGNETGSVGGGGVGGGGGGWGSTGWLRMLELRGRRSGRLAAARGRPAASRRAVRRAPRPARRTDSPGSSSGAAGCWSRQRRSASCRGSSTPTTPSRLAPAIAAVVADRRHAALASTRPLPGSPGTWRSVARRRGDLLRPARP